MADSEAFKSAIMQAAMETAKATVVVMTEPID